MLVKLTKVYRSDKDKNGNALKTKDGRPYTRVSIKTQEHGEKWLSGFENFNNQKWREGDHVDLEVEKNGEYLNFSTPSPLQLLTRRVEALEDAFRTFKSAPQRNQMLKDEEVPVFDPKDEEEPDLSNLPF